MVVSDRTPSSLRAARARRSVSSGVQALALLTLLFATRHTSAQPTNSWTILHYAAGSNSSEVDLLSDIQEMMDGKLAEGYELIVLIDRTPGHSEDSTTLGENFIISDIREEGFPESVRVNAYPNPFGEESTIEITGMEIGQGLFLLYDNQGRQVRQEAFPGSRLDFRREGLPGGLYFFTILSDGKPVGSGKMVIGR